MGNKRYHFEFIERMERIPGAVNIEQVDWPKRGFWENECDI